MQKIKQDFKYDQNHNRLTYGLLILGLMAQVVFWGYLNLINQKTLALETELENYSSSKSTQKQQIIVTPQNEAQLSALANAVSLLNRNWFDLLNSLEDAKSDDVDLLELTPDPANQLFRLSAQAIDLNTAFDFNEQLKEYPMISQPEIVSHQAVLAGNSNVVRFEVTAKWVSN